MSPRPSMSSSWDTDSIRSEKNRRLLLDQLAHLVDEVEALRSHVDLVPDAVLKGRPLESDPSFSEIYLLLARYDEKVYAPAVERLQDGEKVVLHIPESSEYLPDQPDFDENIAAILDRVRDARSWLVSLLEDMSVEDWCLSVTLDGEEVDVFGLAYAIAQHDAAFQQAAAYRLHESRLTSREQDLPK